MAGKSKSIYLTVADLKTHKSVFKKMFYNASEYRDYVKTPEFIALYPADQYYVVKELY